MEVFRVEFDWRYQALHAHDPDLFIRTVTTNGFDGRPLRKEWPRMECFVADPTLPQGDFFGFSLGVIGVGARALEALRDLIDATGELLPVFVNDQKLHLFNATRFAESSLDRQGSTYHLLGGKYPAGIENFAFFSDRLHSESLFRLHDECSILTVSGQPNPNLDFRRRVSDYQLTGLVFPPIWKAGVAPFRSMKP